jgi:hypothetical protein
LATTHDRLPPATFHPGTPADAYYAGTVQTVSTAASIGTTLRWPWVRPVPGPLAVTPTQPVNPAQAVNRAQAVNAVRAVNPARAGGPAHPAKPVTATGPAGGSLACAGGVISHLHGLGVSPSLTPEIGLEWQRGRYGQPVRYGKSGGYAVHVDGGADGLNLLGLGLFQFTLTGTITVNLDVSVSGAARCAMTLPAVVRSVPAGGLGTVVLRLRPTLGLVTTGELDVATSATLTCYAWYRWYAGTASRTDYCTATHQPLRISSLKGASATVTGTIAVSASLDDLPVVTGTVGAALHAGYHPGGGQVAETDARSVLDLTAPLGSLWNGAPSVPVARGTVFSAVLATWNRRPPAATGPTAITVTPSLAYPWSGSVCGYNTPTFGRNVFTIAGSGFVPGEPVGVAAGWAAYPGPASADPDGSFTVTNSVGEVPSVLDQVFSVAADGTAGSSAGSTIELDADGCLRQSDLGGRLAVRWGGNGFDPDSAVSLRLDGAVVSTATTDSFGSGGATAELACPAAGRYAWQVAGIVNGVPVAAASWLTCVAHVMSPLYAGVALTRMSGAAATPAASSLSWRAPPAGRETPLAG